MEKIVLHKIKDFSIKDNEVKILTSDTAAIKAIKPSLIYAIVQKPIAFYDEKLRKGYIINGQIMFSFIGKTVPGEVHPITVELTITKQEERFIETYDVEEDLFYMVVA